MAEFSNANFQISKEYLLILFSLEPRKKKSLKSPGKFLEFFWAHGVQTLFKALEYITLLLYFSVYV